MITYNSWHIPQRNLKMAASPVRQPCDRAALKRSCDFQPHAWKLQARVTGDHRFFPGVSECSYLVAIAVSFMYARKENMDSIFIPVVEEL